MDTRNNFTLSEQQKAHFVEKGWVAVDLFSADEIAVIRQCIESNSRIIKDMNDNAIMTFYNNVYNLETPRDLHLFHDPLSDMFGHPSLVTKLNQLVGDDLLLWYTNVFCKLQGQGEIKWHQAIEYYASGDIDFDKKTLIYDPDDEPVNLTVWVAIDKADKENGCMCFANGSQHTKFEVIKSAKPAEQGIFAGIGAHNTVWQTNNAYSFDYKFDERDWPLEYVPLNPGQAIIFTERTMHCSPANDSDRRRMGIIGRYVRPSTQIYPGRLKGDVIDENGHDISRHYNILVSGNDNYGKNVVRDNNDLTELETAFQTMLNKVRFSKVKVPEDKIRLQLSALEKKVVEGDCNEEEPNPMLYPKKYVHWMAWSQLSAISSEQAMQQYVDLVSNLPEQAPQKSDDARVSRQRSAGKIDQTAIEDWLLTCISETMSMDIDELETDVPIMNYGLSSLHLARIAGDLGDWLEEDLNVEQLYEYPTIEGISESLVCELSDVGAQV